MTLHGHLNALEHAGLIRAVASHDDLAYLFRHGLIQDAAYSTLLKPQRRAWHRAAAEVLEAHVSAAGDLVPVLAHHFAEAGDERRALHYFTRAGDAAFDRYAIAEAGDYYARALALVTARAAAHDPEPARHLAVRFGRTLELRSQFEAALRHYEAMQALARERSDPALELAVLVERAKVHSTANMFNDPERSRQLLEQAAPLAERLGDHATQARLLWTLMLQNVMRAGDPAERIAYGEKALALARRLDLREQQAYILQDLWFGYGGALRWEATRANLLEARQLWTELRNPNGLIEVLGRLSIVAFFLGDYDEGLALAAEAHQLAQSVRSLDMQALSHAFVSLLHADRGDYARAIDVAAQALADAQPSANVTVLVGTRADLGLAYGDLGAVERGLDYAQAAHALAMSKFPLLAGWSGAALARLHLLRADVQAAAATLAELSPYQEYQRGAGFMAMMWLHTALAEGELALAQGHAPRAAALMTEVADTQQATGLRFRVPDVLHLRGRALLDQGRLAQARADFQSARLEALAVNARRTLWRILAGLAEIDARSGQPEQAAQWRAQARQLLEYLAAHAPAALRGAFLAQPAVQAVLRPDA